MKKRLDTIITVLALIALLLSPADAQQDSTHSQLALNEIEIHTAARVDFDIKNPIQRYKYRAVQPVLIKQIKNDIVEQFRQNAYYLATVDSVHSEKNVQKKQVKLHIYLTPAEQFILNRITPHIPDTVSTTITGELSEELDTYRQRPYTDFLQKRLFKAIVTIFENNGYPLCRVYTEEFDLDTLSNSTRSINLQLRIEPGPLVRVAGLRLPAESHISVRYLERVFRFQENELYREERIQRYQRQLVREDFVETAIPPQLVQENDSLYYLSLDFKEASTTTFDGIVGYNPPPVNQTEENGYFTGQLNIGLRNVFGTGRRLNVFWQKPDRFSDEFRVQYREPFVMGLPFHTGVEMHRLVRDTTYIDWEYAARAEIPLNENLQGVLRVYQRQVFPDSLASVVQRLPQTEALHTELGLNWDTRDDIQNPRSGLFLSARFDYGTQRNVGPAFLLQEDSLAEKINSTRFTGQLMTFFETWDRQIVALNLNTVLIGYEGQRVRAPDMFWFGGATTVRGYREQQFFGERVGWLNTEYRFLLGPRSRFFVFTDVGYYERGIPDGTKEFLTGFGLGVRFPGPLGALQVDYGLAKGASFQEGKIHFRLINEF